MILALALASYALLALTLMSIGLRFLSLNPNPSTAQQRDAVIWWALFWPYMGVRWLIKRN